jgi:hypothetical protein
MFIQEIWMDWKFRVLIIRMFFLHVRKFIVRTTYIQLNLVNHS